MAEGINANLKESSDLLAKVLDSLTKTSAAVDALPNKIKEVTKSLEAASKGFEGLAKAADGANAGQAGGSRMPWLARLGFGAKTEKPQQPAAKVGGGGPGGTAPVAAAPSGQRPSPKEVALTVGAGMAGMGAAAWAGTPGVTNAVTRQAGLFPMAFSTPGFVNSEKIDATNQRLRGLMGANLSGLYDDLAAANMTRYRGFGMNTPEFDSMMRTAGNMYALTGMSNPMSMQGSLAMYDAQGGSNLASVGIFTHDLATGKPKDVGQIVDELWRRGGWEGKNITLEQFETELGGGFLGAELKNLFGHDPGLYMQVVEAFKLKVKAKGRSGIRWNAPSDDPNSAKSVAQEMGLSDLAPWSVMGESNEARRNSLDSASEGLYSGFQVSENIIQGFNDALSQATDALGPFADIMYGLKGGFQDFSASGEGASMIQMASSMVGMIMPGLKLFMAGGGDTSGAVTSIRGTSTSDSVPAMLSKGEYVINARSASILGTEYLDRLNSTGNEFGSGFAQPMRFFNNGGKVVEYGYTKHTIEGTVPDDRGGYVTAGEGTLDGWSTLLSGDPALKSYKIPGSSLSLTLLARDGIGQYMADFAAAWQAHPKLGKGRLDLSASGQSGAHHARTTGHGGVSNHAAGVAMDLRWDVYRAHDGDVYDPTNEETAAIRELLSRFNKLEWGGDWVGPGNEGMLDEQHFEIESPATWGRGGHVVEGVPEDKPSTTETQLPRVSGVMATTSGGGGGPESLMNPMLAAQGISARWAKAFSLAPHGKRGNLLSTISHSLFPGMLAGAALTLFGGAAALMGSVGDTGVGADEESASDGEDSSIDLSVKAASGSGPEWLYQFLVAKGARGDLLRQLWTIGMRESGGNPNLIANIGVEPPRFDYPNVPDNFKFDPKNKYGYNGHEMDVGLFQINSEAHFDKVGGNMLNVIDPNDNFAMLEKLSGGFKNWTPWGIKAFNGDSISYIDWSGWDKPGSSAWKNVYGPATEQHTQTYWDQYKDYNTEGYSKGAWRTKEEIAQIHDGEMIIPANAAEEFRKMMREAVSGGRASSGDVHINLTIARATEEEAMRFAKTVQKILKDDERLETMRTR